MIKIEGKPITTSTVFLLPMYTLSWQKCKEIGFINAFVEDTQKTFTINTCLLLFEADEQFLQEQINLITLLNGAVLEVYGYGEKLIVIALSIPDTFIWDYEKVLYGRYSQLSEKYQNLFLEKAGEGIYKEKDGRRLQLLIIQKDPLVHSFLERTYDLDIPKDSELWEKFDRKKETITPELLEEILLEINNREIENSQQTTTL